MVTDRLWRTLSAFNRSTRKWAPIPLRDAQSPVTQTLSPASASRSIDTVCTQTLSLVTWNIDAFSSRPVSRAKRIAGHILDSGPKSPEIIFLQEVTSDVRKFILDDSRVRATFLVTDAGEDQKTSSFEGVPFATMTLLSSARFASGPDSQKEGDDGFMLGRVCRVTLPSQYKRDALYVDIIPPTSPPYTFFRLINVHLDSLWDTLPYRAQQMEILSNVLREPGCNGGIIAGDFTAIRPEDDGLVYKNGLVDAWVALHGGMADPDGATWAVGVERRDGLGPGRLDKVAMMGLNAKEMEVLRPDLIDVPRPGEKPVEIPWSDHCGLRCTFTI